MRMDEELKSRKVNELVDFQHIYSFDGKRR